MQLCRAIALRLKVLMNELNVTPKELTKKSKLSNCFINSVLSSKIKDIELKKLLIIVKALDISIEYFFDDSIFMMSNIELPKLRFK